MEQNKTGKYLKYAIGEIILVMIGILLALQVNNWNQNRINRDIEKETLSSLKIDLDSAMVQLDEKIRQNSEFRFLDSTALEIIHKNEKIPEDSIQTLLLSHIFTPGFDPELGTLNEILNTGKTDIIKNKALKNHISSWNKYMDELAEVDSKLLHLDEQLKLPLYSKHLAYRYYYSGYSKNVINSTTHIPYSNFKIDIDTAFYTLEFENMLSNYMIFGGIQHTRLLDIKQKMNEMILLIEEDIKN
ncbi:DUF6090 family protein [Winogradskyella immobilis]|uniref:Uncharacterized protein n=1 Tax=Winogradskyella immobilis TaxID=2816852 RepID=A0ABS8EQ92_9FLAO|nr:DUF6090 family protein [Winogradskyella immobilis]MCC1485002.1 hypothetical protein [Winogradskyella immobilis]MCG0017094.1 hypothetical protein [Winogradskyella immobilis]